MNPSRASFFFFFNIKTICKSWECIILYCNGGGALLPSVVTLHFLIFPFWSSFSLKYHFSFRNSIRTTWSYTSIIAIVRSQILVNLENIISIFLIVFLFPIYYLNIFHFRAIRVTFFPAILYSCHNLIWTDHIDR